MIHPANCPCPAAVCTFRRTRGVKVIPVGVSARSDDYEQRADAETERAAREHTYDTVVRYGSR